MLDGERAAFRINVEGRIERNLWKIHKCRFCEKLAVHTKEQLPLVAIEANIDNTSLLGTTSPQILTLQNERIQFITNKIKHVEESKRRKSDDITEMEENKNGKKQKNNTKKEKQNTLFLCYAQKASSFLLHTNLPGAVLAVEGSGGSVEIEPTTAPVGSDGIGLRGGHAYHHFARGLETDRKLVHSRNKCGTAQHVAVPASARASRLGQRQIAVAERRVLRAHQSPVGIVS